MSGQVCTVAWADGVTLECTWRRSRWLPMLCRADGVTLGPTTAVHPRIQVPELQFLRHEFTHARQQAEAKKAGMGLVRWVLRYLIHPSVRRAAELEADLARHEWWENSMKVGNPTITVLKEIA